MPKAKAAALHALALDETLAEAHTSLGRVLAVYRMELGQRRKRSNKRAS